MWTLRPRQAEPFAQGQPESESIGSWTRVFWLLPLPLSTPCVSLAESRGCVELCGLKAERRSQPGASSQRAWSCSWAQWKLVESMEVKESPLNWSKVGVSVSGGLLSEAGADSGRKGSHCGFRASLLEGFKTNFWSVILYKLEEGADSGPVCLVHFGGPSTWHNHSYIHHIECTLWPSPYKVLERKWRPDTATGLVIAETAVQWQR